MYKEFSVCGLVLKDSGPRRLCLNISKNYIRSLTAKPLYKLVVDEAIIAPSTVDMHVHLRGLGLSYKATVSSETAAAASAGIAVVADMPNTVPYLNTVEDVKVRLEELRLESLVDYALYAGLPTTMEELVRLARLPIVGFKLYPHDLYSPLLCGLLRVAEKYNKLIIVHAEHPDLLGIETGWNRSVTAHPCHAEIAAVSYLSELVVKCGARPRIHITHASCPSTIRLAKRYGFTVDTTPHHILEAITIARLEELDPCIVKVNPPIRGYVEAQGLLKTILEGLVDAIASDHAPHALWEKSLNPLLCPPGISSIEHWPAHILYFTATTGLLDYYVRLTSYNPARILNAKRRGCLEPGCYADIAIYGIDGFERIVVDKYSKSKSLLAYILDTKLQLLKHYVRGILVYSIDEGVVVDKGFGVNIVEQKSTSL